MPRRGKNIWEESFTWVLVGLVPVLIAFVWSFQYVLEWFTSQSTWAQVIEVFGAATFVSAFIALYLRSRRR